MYSQLTRLALVITLAGASITASAQDYTVKVESKLNDLAIRIEPVSTDTMLVMKLTNADDTKVRCVVEYDADPQLPYKQSLTLKPGKTEQSVLRIRRHLFTITAIVQCAPEEWGSMEPPTKPAETAPERPQPGADKAGA